MARFSLGALSAGAGSTTLPLMSLYAVANAGYALREVGVTNTTATAVAIKLVRLSTTGTQGSAIGGSQLGYRVQRLTPTSKMFQTHTVAPTVTDDLGYRASLGAAVGAGVIWTFGDTGIECAPATTNGIGLLIENGTGQVCQVYFCWDE
jgi:hypothetical protein